MGVFLATDALLFYFFWELALIPVYFLCFAMGWGKKNHSHIQIFYLYFSGIPDDAGRYHLSLFSYQGSFICLSRHFTRLICRFRRQDQSWLFWLIFIAFAVKMPIFPFHTWQPDTYEQSPTAVTMVLSGLMVKMGLFGLIRWLAPVLPDGNLCVGRYCIRTYVLSG